MASRIRQAWTQRLQELVAAVGEVDAALAAHRKICHGCNARSPEWARYCDTGWDLVKQQHAAHQALREYDQPATGGTATLF